MKATKLFTALLTLLSIPMVSSATPPAIPSLATWEAQMKLNATFISAQPTSPSHSTCGAEGGCDVIVPHCPTHGDQKNCPALCLTKPPSNEGLLWYYDGNRVMRQIAKYTKDDSYLTAAAKCRDYYAAYLDCPRLNSWIPNSVDGWRNFAKGFYYDWVYDNNAASKTYLINIARNGKQSQSQHMGDIAGYLTTPSIVDASREIAYAINDWHYCHLLGVAGFTGRDPYLDVAYYQLDTWKTYLTGYPASVYPGDPTAKYQPFMFALTAEALISVYEQADTTQDDKDKIKKKIYDVAKLTYDKLYSDANRAFMSNTGNPTVWWCPINVLICPLYGWLWHVTGETYWLDAGDKAFSQGVVYGWAEVWGGKQFSQMYRWSFDYVNWRSVDPESELPPPPVAGAPDELAQVKTYPNPVRISSVTTSKISGLVGSCLVEIFNNNGDKVRELKEAESAVPGTVEWDGKNDIGDFIGAGVYMYVVKSPAGNRKVGKIAVLK